MSQDYWDWVDQKKPIAPLAAAIQPSQEQSPGVMQQPKDPIMGMAQQAGVNAAAKGAEAGFKGYQLANAEAAFQAADAAQLASQGLGAAQVASTVGATSAPLAAGAATTGAAVGGEAALAAMGPVGWAIGAGLLAKKLGIF